MPEAWSESKYLHTLQAKTAQRGIPRHTSPDRDEIVDR
jgi:hypothetical protein